MGKYYNHWKSQLELAEEASDEIYIQHCQQMMKSYIDEEDLDDDNEDEWDYDDYSFGGDISVQFYPKSIGQWEIGRGMSKLIFPLDEKPNIVHRYFSKLLLGWRWVDKK